MGIRKYDKFDIANNFLMVLLMGIILYPLYFTIIASVSDPYRVAMGTVTVFPKGITFEAYNNVFERSEIWTGYRNTLIYTTFGTCLSLFLTILPAYALSKKYLAGRSIFTWFFLITIFFSGGLIPTYLVVRDLNLINQAYTLIILSSFSVFNMIITRTFFVATIPESLYESARIDGASEFTSFIKIALPLAAPIIAVITLYYAVARWNSFFDALIYVSKREFMPLQIVLRNILILSQSLIQNMDTEHMEADELQELVRRAYLAESMKYALIFIASFPLLVAYPFAQKYFVKGVMIGSIKG